jgi:hypothetical protein
MPHTTAPGSLEEGVPVAILESIGGSVYQTTPFPTSMEGYVEELHYLPAAWGQDLERSRGLMADGYQDEHFVGRNPPVLEDQGLQAESGQSHSFQTPAWGIPDGSSESREVLDEGNTTFAEPILPSPSIAPNGRSDQVQRFSFLSLQQNHSSTFEFIPASNPDFSLHALYGSNSNSASLGSPQACNSRKSEMKPRCFEHGCDGRSFSNIYNLIRHQRENDTSVVKPVCSRCGRKFTRKNARDRHFNEKCKYRNKGHTVFNYPERVFL